MREILFRGKQQSGNWVYGNLSYYPSWNRSVIRTNDPHETDSWEVLSKTVGQFTGLLDKNGKKIFEGDFIYQKFDDGESETAEVIWHDSPEGIGWYVHSISPIPDFYPFCSYDCDAWEVVGNIHDNPELLRKEESE